MVHKHLRSHYLAVFMEYIHIFYSAIPLKTNFNHKRQKLNICASDVSGQVLKRPCQHCQSYKTLDKDDCRSIRRVQRGVYAILFLSIISSSVRRAASKRISLYIYCDPVLTVKSYLRVY